MVESITLLLALPTCIVHMQISCNGAQRPFLKYNSQQSKALPGREGRVLSLLWMLPASMGNLSSSRAWTSLNCRYLRRILYVLPFLRVTSRM